MFVGTKVGFVKRNVFQQLARFSSDLSSVKNSINLSSKQTILSSIDQILKYQDSNKTEDLKPLFQSVLENKELPLDLDLVKEIVQLESVSSDYIVQLFETFKKTNPDKFISRDIAMIALRKSLYHSTSIPNAIKIIDLTAASDSYIDHLTKKRNSNIIKVFGGGATGIALVDVGIRSLEFSPTLSIYSMLFAYFFNLSFFGFIAFGSRLSSSTTNIQWDGDATSSHKHVHLDELKMMSKVAELAVELKGVDGYPSDEFEQVLENHKISAVQPETDVLIQEYWLSGGNNFEWVEPDQDPAELIWRAKVNSPTPSLQWTKGLLHA